MTLELIKRGAGGKILRGPGGEISRCCCPSVGPCSQCPQFRNFTIGLNFYHYLAPANPKYYQLWANIYGELSFRPADLSVGSDAYYLFLATVAPENWIEIIGGCTFEGETGNVKMLATILPESSGLTLYFGIINSELTGSARLVGYSAGNLGNEEWTYCPECGNANLVGGFAGGPNEGGYSGYGHVNFSWAYAHAEICGSGGHAPEVTCCTPVIWFSSWGSNSDGTGGWLIESNSPTQINIGPQYSDSMYCGLGDKTKDEWLENNFGWWEGCFTGSHGNLCYITDSFAMPPPPDMPETIYHFYMAMPNCSNSTWDVSYAYNNPYHPDGLPIGEWVSGGMGMTYVSTSFSTPSAPSTPPVCYCAWMCDYDCGTSTWGAPYMAYCYEGFGEMPWQIYGTQAYGTFTAGTTPSAPTEPGQCE